MATCVEQVNKFDSFLMSWLCLSAWSQQRIVWKKFSSSISNRISWNKDTLFEFQNSWFLRFLYRNATFPNMTLVLTKRQKYTEPLLSIVKPEISCGTKMWLRHGPCGRLCVWQTLRWRLTEVNVLLERRNLSKQIVGDKQRDLWPHELRLLINRCSNTENYKEVIFPKKHMLFSHFI